MARLFEPTTLNGMRLANRFVRSATWTGMADTDGACTTRKIELYRGLARGGVGLIITGHAYVMKNGQAAPWQLGLDQDRNLPGLEKLTRAVHGCGGKIVAQLAHAGAYADPSLTGGPVWAASPSGRFPHQVTAMGLGDIETVINGFAAAADRAAKAGFDGIQLHAAHGYLINQFLSAAFNSRSDIYGGCPENRLQFLKRVMGAVKERVGQEFPILVKLNARDFLPGGIEIDDAVCTAAFLENLGAHAIEISGGTRESGAYKSSRTGIQCGRNEAYFEAEVRRIRSKVKIPLILVGGIRSLDTARRIVEQSAADYIAMARPLIREPELIGKWAQGLSQTSACISDNQCLALGLAGNGIACSVKGPPS